jgi:MoaA/NifB/PqqE/SkfB family radical SAM enzyme
LSEKSFLTKFIEAGFTRVEVLENSDNKRTRNRDAYVVTVSAQKAAAGLRTSLNNSQKPKLNRENAARTLKELWVFPVAPETCNLSCTHCLYAASPRTRNPYRLSANQLADLMSQVEATGARPHFLFTGGEPTLHPELYDLLESVDRQRYSFQLMTNGTRIQKENAERLSKMSHLSKVQLSLESADPKVNDSIYGAGLHRRVLKTVETLSEQSVPVAVAVTPMEINEADLSALEKLAEDKGAEIKHILLYDLGAAKENGIKPAREARTANRQAEVELMCNKGVAYSEGSFYSCPVLVKDVGAKLGDTLEEALSPAARTKVRRLRETHAACQICLKGST